MRQSFLKELAELIDAKIIDDATASRIKEYYNTKTPASSNLLTTILTILGSLLAGLGIILIIAHNWDSLGETLKTILAFIPLLAGQAACFYTVNSKKNNKTWTESSSIFLFCSVGATISLIGQIYHISGTLEGFLLTWILLTLPLVYIIPSNTVALANIILITWYASANSYYAYPFHTSYLYPPLLLLLGPFYYMQWKKQPTENYFHFLNWFLCLSLLIALPALSHSDGHEVPLLGASYLAMCCTFCYIGKNKRWDRMNLFLNPFRTLGVLGVLVVLLLWSYEDFFWSNWHYPNNFSPLLSDPLFYILILFIVITFYLLKRSYANNRENTEDPTGLSIFIWLIAIDWGAKFGAFLINIWILFIAIYFVQERHPKGSFWHSEFWLDFNCGTCYLQIF